MIKSVVALLTGILVLIAVTTGGVSAAGSGTLESSEQVFDFGHIGIGYMFFHTFHVVNNGREPVRITDLNVSCDCSRVIPSDSIIAPGDTVFFRVKFNSADFFGPTTKSFTAYFDDPDTPSIKFFFLSDIGQWLVGLKPNPISVFLLPKQKSKKVTVANTTYDHLSITVVETDESAFTLNILKSEAARGESIELEVVPREELDSGTVLSSFVVHLTTNESDKPVTLTMPIKIVKY